MTNTKTSLFGGALFFAGLATGSARSSPESTKRGCTTIAAALVATASLVNAPALRADIIHVPNDFPTIQEAIDASVDGDDVVVAPGEYVETIDFLGKTIVLRSVHGAEVTTIDGNDAGTVVTCESGEGPGATLQGFTVANGDNWPDAGGGMRIGAASTLTVSNCTFTNNYAQDGGGMFNAGNVTLTSCTFVTNEAVDDFFDSALGGGLLNNGYATIIDCSFQGNCAVYGDYNYLVSYGGGMQNIGTALILSSSFDDNYAYNGGGLSNWGNLLALIDCTFTDNITDNNGDGGGVAACCGDVTIINCTFIGNDAGNDGGGVAGDAVIRNSILWGNTPDQIDGDATVTFSNVQGGWPGQGNIDADPLFVDPDNGDYRLSPGSPCIDAGDNTEVPPDEFDLDEDGDTDEALPFDLDGNPRFVDDPATKDTGNGVAPIVDLGPYEFQVVASCTWDLDDDGAVGSGDLIMLLGSWGDPYGTEDLLELLGAWGLCPE